MFPNINWRDDERKDIVNNEDMSNLKASWQNGSYKNKHIEQHKNAEQQDVTYIKNKLIVCCWFL